MPSGESLTPTPWGVHCQGVDPEVGAGPCNDGKIIYLIEAAYLEQLRMPDVLWRCPRCGASAWWDDDNWESAINYGEVELT